MNNSAFIDMSYQIILRRKPDKEGKKQFLTQLTECIINRDQFIDTLINSPEFADRHPSGFGESIHHSRIQWVKSFPKADIIVDLGGSAKGDARGALVLMGYPYSFQKLYIIDLPLAERIKLYSDGYKICKNCQTEKGPVEYIYSSMTDLSYFADHSVDFVNSGQSIEHITEEEADVVLQECLRILRPGGHLCIDTPNGKSTRIQQTDFIDPDHKVEYSHNTLLAKIESAGFTDIQSFGMNYMPNAHNTGKFELEEASINSGIFSDIEKCYILAYRCRKPVTD
jgi:predicted SAM-dependent methyltransferase